MSGEREAEEMPDDDGRREGDDDGAYEQFVADQMEPGPGSGPDDHER